ncbi:MAG: YeeE/YedE family protein [Myxococcota bacterium]|nr:YeeE/YedE family protein [Myxococcota bacterium]
MEHFTPLPALAGGALIGLAATLLMAANGRIAGISGILGGALTSASAGGAWRLAFLVGLPLGALLAHGLGAAPPPGSSERLPWLVGAGLLVGLGTQLGSGCTSGHGVCGLARGSRRSLAATLVFMTVAVATVYLRRYLGGA